MNKERLKYLEIEKSYNSLNLSTPLKIAIAITLLFIVGILLFSKLFLD
jgi:hypothetical protein